MLSFRKEIKSIQTSAGSNWLDAYFVRYQPSELAVYFILVMVVISSYGYEIFNFNLSIDEEMRSNQAGMWFDWISQGRWGMAFLNFLVVPHPVVPLISIFLGVFGAAIGILKIIETSFNLDRLGLTVVTALSVTVPTLSFSFTYSTIAYGIGLGLIALAVANWLVCQKAWQSTAVACLLAGFAIGIYQTFVFVVVMLSVIQTWRFFYSKTNADILTNIKYPALFLLGSVAIYWIINLIVLRIFRLDIIYIGQFIDIPGFFQSPITKTIASFWRCVEIIELEPGKFGIRSIWLAIIVPISLTMALAYPIYKRRYRDFVWMLAIVLTIFCVVVLADAIAQSGAPLRSVIYIPVGIAFIVAAAYLVCGNAGKIVLVLLCGLAVIGNSQVNNHLFASSASAEFKDRMLAETIINEARKIKPNNTSALKIEVIGNLMWPITGIQSKSDTFGASFFEWDGGNRNRVAAYLSLNGLISVGANEEDRKNVYKYGIGMPAWPHAGWISVADDILILKLSSYTAPQKASLCLNGITDLCN